MGSKGVAVGSAEVHLGEDGERPPRTHQASCSPINQIQGLHQGCPSSLRMSLKCHGKGVATLLPLR